MSPRCTKSFILDSCARIVNLHTTEYLYPYPTVLNFLGSPNVSNAIKTPFHI